MRLDELKNDFPDIPDFVHDMIQEEVELNYCRAFVAQRHLEEANDCGSPAWWHLDSEGYI